MIYGGDTKQALFSDKQLHSSDAVLRTYTSETVSVIGELQVEVKYEAQTKHLSLLVVPGSGPSLIGHDWMSYITFNWAEVKHTRSQNQDLQALLDKYPELFKDELGTMTNFTAKLDLQPESIDKEGLHSSPKTLEAIPKNVHQLRSLLGLINYYGKFVNNLASILHPLYQLLKSNSKWNWGKHCDNAFAQVKQKLVSNQLLVHYNPKLPLQLATDASPYGVGAVISHISYL